MVVESLLEMHFHAALIDLFSRTFGRPFLKMIKPSTRKEYKYGFDQGFVWTDDLEDQFLSDLETSITAQSTRQDRMYLAYFFQFKRVDKISRNSTYKPATYHTPYYRSPISLTPNKFTKLSQHDTLLRLANIRNAMVYYACGMIFDQSEVWEPVDLEKLRFVPLSSSPTNLNLNQSHFITFQTKTDPTPLWCSEPVQGESLSINEIIETGQPKLLRGPELSALIQDMMASFQSPREEIINKVSDSRFNPNFYPESFTILEFWGGDTTF